MVFHTWGFVPTRPNRRWVKVELRAEQGAVLRVSGAPYSAVLGSLARVRAALQSMKVPWPGKALTLHVHPPCRPEEVLYLDLPVALTLLALKGQLDADLVAQIASTGTLSLDGKLHGAEEYSSSRECWPSHASHAVPRGLRLLVGPGPQQASLPVRNIQVRALADFTNHLDSWLRVPSTLAPSQRTADSQGNSNRGWANLKGEGHAKAWLCIAARLRLPVLMAGAPGVGKTSLARASKDLIAGRNLQRPNLVPFLAPHPTGGSAGLLGSWRRGQPVPGAWALAHNGVLFLDELPEWPKPAREGLRHILETGALDLHRAEGAARWTSNAWILAAMNLCPCGQHERGCVCTSSEKLAYRKRLSAPLLERFPVQLEVGLDEHECVRTWSECQAWVATTPHGDSLSWSAGAHAALGAAIESGLQSKRLQGHLKRLSEGHALWREVSEVSESDVHAAHEVTWMNRPGWRTERVLPAMSTEDGDTYI
jgi:magnesium chelatase family protein